MKGVFTMKQENSYHYSEETGVAEVKFFFEGKEYLGKARIAPQDREYGNKHVGFYIAEERACISVIAQEIKRLNEELKIFRDFYSQVSSSKNFQKHGYTERQLRKRQFQIKVNIDELQSCIEDRKAGLQQYINDKDKLYRNLERNVAIKNSRMAISNAFAEQAKSILKDNPLGLNNLYYLGELYPNWQNRDSDKKVEE